MDIKGIENRKDSRLVDGSFGMIDGTSMYTDEQEQKDDAALNEKNWYINRRCYNSR